jgi:NADPH2:quinone reductase
MSRVVRIHRHGGPEELKVEDEVVGAPGAGEARIRQTAIGLNFVDIYHRIGQFGADPMPFVLGVQGVGVVEALGEGASGIAVGDRVAYAGAMGAYREVRLMPADRLIRLPADIDDGVAAAGLLRGLTAQYLVRRLYRIQPGDAVLVHAAAGGVGLVLCQWAKHLGATVIGTVSSPAKAAIAAAHGCDHPVLYGQGHDWVAEVQRLAGGRGVPVVYDSVGRDTFMGSLDCLRPMGMAINYGTASGQVEPFPLQRLHKKSLVVTRPTLGTWIADRGDLERAADEFLNLVRGGIIRVEVARSYPLADVADAHRDLEGRRTTGSMILVP